MERQREQDDRQHGAHFRFCRPTRNRIVLEIHAMQGLHSESISFVLADATFRFTVGRPERTTTASEAIDETATEASQFPRFWARWEQKDTIPERQQTTARPSLTPSIADGIDNATSNASEQGEPASCESLVAPLTPPSDRAQPRDPTLCAPKQCSSLQQPRIDVLHTRNLVDSLGRGSTKTRKRTRQKTQHRREQCRINQARYRAKLKRLKLEALMGGGGSSNDESSSSSLTSKLATPPAPKKPRKRVKTERRMQQCRINQARYRNKQRAHELALEKSIQQLKAEIQQLESRRLLLVEETSRIELENRR